VSLADRELRHNESDAILKIRSCCVCGYDSRVFRNGHRKVKPPMVLGHEICAETTHDIGPVKAGARVAVYPVQPCLVCRYCLQGKYNLCTDIREIGSTIDGGFAEYIGVPKEIIQIGGMVPVPDSLGNEEASLIEPLACCLNGFSQINGTVGKDSTVAIIGDGPVGLLHLQLSKSLLGARTAVVGRVPERMGAAESLGADRVFSAHNDISEMLAFTGGSGYELVIVAASEPSALDLATKIASKGSKISIFAGMKDHSQALDPNLVHYNQISISGSFSSTPDNFRQAASLAGRGIVDLSRIVTHRYPLEAIGEALLATESYRGLRAAVIP
jgi:L-iditol 2-dehydrogenase